jgi:hypothetical protein
MEFSVQGMPTAIVKYEKEVVQAILSVRRHVTGLRTRAVVVESTGV